MTNCITVFNHCQNIVSRYISVTRRVLPPIETKSDDIGSDVQKVHACPLYTVVYYIHVPCLRLLSSVLFVEIQCNKLPVKLFLA